MGHPVHLMPAIQMNQLLVWALLCLFAHVTPPAISTIVALLSLVCVALVPFKVSPQLMQLLLFFSHSLLVLLSLHDSLIVLLSLFLYIHSCFLYKWIFSKLESLLLLHALNSLPLPFVMHWYAWLCCYCSYYFYCWCSP